MDFVINGVGDFVRSDAEAVLNQLGYVRLDRYVVQSGQAVCRFDAVAHGCVFGVVALVVLAEVHGHALVRTCARRPRYGAPGRADDDVGIREICRSEILNLLERTVQVLGGWRPRSADNGDLMTTLTEPVCVL